MFYCLFICKCRVNYDHCISSLNKNLCQEESGHTVYIILFLDSLLYCPLLYLYFDLQIIAQILPTVTSVCMPCVFGSGVSISLNAV